MKPVFSRLNDRETKSRKEILRFAVLFYLVTRIVSMIAVTFAARLYFLYGLDAMAALRFDGSMEGIAYKALENGVWPALAMIMLGAPLLEECAFRLGLSFKRRDAVIGAGALAAFTVSAVFGSWLWAAVAGAIAAAAVRFATADGFWLGLKTKWLKPAAWASAALFGLAHLFAMHGLSLVLLPYALLLCMMLFLTGMVFVYVRVNLGFGWAVAVHIINNIPAAVLLLGML